MKRNIEIGAVIKRIQKEKGISVKEFANKLCRTRGTIYSIYKRPIVDYELLRTISEILDYDFLSLCYNTPKKQSAFIIILESDKSKMEELTNDKSVKIIKVIDLEEINRQKMWVL